MINTNNLQVIETKSTIGRLKVALNSTIVLLAALSFCYFVYYIGVLSDEMVLDYSAWIFKPLASFLNPDNPTIDIYKITSLYLLLAIFPASLCHYFLDKIEEFVVKFHHKQEEKKLAKEQKQAYLDSLVQYDVIKSYSICLSIDYSAEGGISPRSKKMLNAVLYNKIKQNLKTAVKDIEVQADGAVVISSHNFNNYDSVYSLLLKTLSKMEKTIEKKGDIKFIPSITTDAHYQDANNECIKTRHFLIQSFNFKNKSLTSAVFRKKYRHLNHQKYAGVPIGEYAYFKNNKAGTFDLNIVCKDLNRTLTMI